MKQCKYKFSADPNLFRVSLSLREMCAVSFSVKPNNESVIRNKYSIYAFDLSGHFVSLYKLPHYRNSKCITFSSHITIFIFQYNS